ncbi:armadillo repeat-containing protein 2 isoform X2 [Ascaphus truei]|uniref:armadillo repeat-containing protein 2 isoform X2 n=1 Tax=Ascaphus truei TaxID=8439 RepID=UPI003F5A62D1
MHSSRDKKSDPFYKPPTSVQKTSAEIINEARNALRTLRTQRPFTPREDQRKLFGPTSSRTLDNRPPSSFSLHTSSFESPDSRPVSGARLIPLSYTPKLPEDDRAPTPPQPRPGSACVRRASITRARLFRTRSQGNLVLDNGLHADEAKERQSSEEASLASKGSFAEDFSDSSCYNTEQQCKVMERSGTSHNKSERDPNGSKTRPSSCPNKSENIAVGSKTGCELESTLNDTETEEETHFWNVKICPVLQGLETAHKGRNLEDLCNLCAQLHKALEDGNMLGKRCKRRALILKTVFKLVEMGSDKLGLSLAKLILALKVSGKNLLNICKLIFKISRSENNDCLFQNNSIIDSLLEVLQGEDAQANSEAFLYCMGAVKFLSGNAVLLNDLLRKPAVEILVELIKQIISVNKAPDMGSSNVGHLLVQLTATLRNLAELPQSRPTFLQRNALPELCALLEHHVCDKDICTNVSRIFSKLSSYNDCCTALADCSRCYALFLSVLNKHPQKQDLVVRMVFTLGNLTAKNSKAREQFYEQRGSITTLLSLLHTYCGLDMNAEQSEKEKTKDQKRPCETEDILIKLIRLLANLSIHPTIGTDLAANHRCVALLMKILEYKLVDECEELVINTVATINNLSYYQDDDSVITDRRLQISELLLKVLLCNNMDGILEAARVFGNLTRYQDVRDFIEEKSVAKEVNNKTLHLENDKWNNLEPRTTETTILVSGSTYGSINIALSVFHALLLSLVPWSFVFRVFHVTLFG